VTPTAFSWNTSVLSGNWNTATNWSPNGIPGASDTVTFGGAPTGQVTVSLNGSEAASTVTFSNTAQSYVIAPTTAATDALTIGTSLTDSATSATADVISAKISATGLTGSVSSATTLKLTNINSANASSITGTFTVTNASGVLEAFSTQAGTDALGTANVTLGAGSLKLDPIPSTFSASGVTGRYFNTGFTAANSGTAVSQVDYGGTPGVTRSDANINFTNFETSGVLPSGISLNASSSNPNNNFAVEWVGGLNILTGGSYTFTDQSDDGSQLVIDGTAVVTNNSNTTATGTVTLGAGTHSFEVRYYQGTGGTNQVISYNGPDTSGSTVVIPGAASLSASGLFQYAAGSTASFANNVTVNASAAGTIDLSLGAMDATLGTLTTGAGSTLNVTGSNTGRTANFGAVTLGGATTFSPTSANVALGAVTDGGSNFAITKSGAGTLSLNATANNFSGATTVNAGTLALGNASALGTNGVSVTAGTVLINAAGALGTTINLNAGETLVANTANVLSGATVNVPAGAFVQGIGANALAGATINLNGGGLSLRADATATIGGTVNVNSNSSVIDVNRLGLNTTTTAVTLSVASLTVANGVTTLNITGPNSFSIQGTSPGFAYALQTAGAFALPTNNLTINTVDANFSFGAAITGTTSITKVGVGQLSFTVDSTGWTAGNTLFIQQGAANVATANGAGASGSTVTLQGGTLGLTGSTITYTMKIALDPTVQIGIVNNGNNVTNTISGALTIAPGQQLQTIGTGTVAFSAALATSTGDYSFNANGSNITLSGQITGTGTPVKLGGSSVTLSSSTANTFTGGVIINAGTLQANGTTAAVGGANNFGTGTITLNGGQANFFADSGQNNVYVNNVVVTGNATIGFGRAGSSSVTNAIVYLSGTLSLTNNTVTFNQNNSYNFAVSGATTLLGNVAMAGNGGVIFSGPVGDGGNGYGITKTATNTVIINGVSTYTGDTHVNSGTFAITSTGKIASSNVFVEAGAVLALPSATGWYSNATQPNLVMTSSPTALAEVQLNYDGALPTMTGGTAPAGGVSGGVIALGLNLALPGPVGTINLPALAGNPAIVMTAFAGPVTQAINLGGIGDGSFYLGAASNITYNGTLTPGGTTYRLGAGGAQLAVSNGLADNGGATNLIVGSSLANGTSTLTNGTGTVILLANSTYTGPTLLNRSSTLVITTAASATAAPLGTGAVTAYGTLVAAGANGSFAAFGAPATNANSSFTFQPGSILSFDNVTTTFQGVTAANNNTRWGTTAPIGLNASTLQLLGQNAAASTTTQTVGPVTFTGGSVLAALRGNATNTVTLTVTSLTRSNRGTLTLVTSTANTLGTTAAGGEQIVDTAAGTDSATTPVAVNTAVGDTGTDTMTAPYLVNGTDNTFVTFGQVGKVGFGDTKFSSLALTSAGATGVVKLTATAAISSNVSVYALAVIGNFALTGTSTITLGSGGLILQGITASQTSTPAYTFGSSGTAEALIYAASSSTFFWVFSSASGTITTTGGVTRFGQGNVSFQANSSGLTGGFVSNATSNNGATIGALSGTIDFNGSTLDLSTHQQNITLNGGTLNIRNSASITLTSTLTVNADSTLNTDRIGSTGSGFAEGFNELIINNSTLTTSAGNSTTAIFQNSNTSNPSVLLTGNATFNTGANLAIVGLVSDGGGGFGITKVGGSTVTLNTPSNVNIADTYTGATNVLNGTLTFASTGTGVVSTTSNFLVAPAATLNLNAATNVGGSNTVTVNSNNLGLGVLGIGYDGALPTITGSSSGVLGVNTTITNTAINLATIGNGTFYLGASSGSTGTYSNASLTIGAGNVWRLGGGGGTLNISNNVITGSSPVLIGAALASGTGSVTNGGGTVNFSVTQSYTGTTTLGGVTVTYINNTTTNSTTAFSQTLTGAVTLLGSSTINAGGSAAFTSNYLLIKGGLNYGGNSLTLQNGVVALDPTAPAATGTGATIVNGGVTLHVSAMNQLSIGNLQLSNGTFVLGKDDGTGVAPSWTQFNSFYSGGYGSGQNQWQITGGNGGFAAKGAPATILINNAGNTAYGYVTSQTVFDRDFRLGNDRRGNLTGVAGSQVFYADQPVILAQNMTLDALHNIGVAPTGPGVSGTPGTGVVYKITGNLNGFGVPHFVTFDSEQAPTGSNFTEAAEVVLAGTNTWTGNPGNVQDVNAGAGGLILDQNVFVRFASNASLPTGNAGAPAFLAAVRDNQNNYGGGYLLTTGDTYTMPAGLSFLFGETVVGSGNIRTSVLGSSSDAGGGGTATLQNATILIANASGVTGGSALVELSPSNTQTLSLLTRDGTLNLGAGANAVTYQLGTSYFYSNTNMFIGDGVLNSLNYGTSSAVNSFGVADAQAGSGRRPLEKDGTGTLVLNNVAYTFPIAGTAAGSNFTTVIGDGTTLGGTLQLGAAGQLPAGALTVTAGTLNLNGFSFTTVGTTNMGSGPAGSTSTITTGAGTLTLAGAVTYNVTNNPGPATINGNLALGSSTRTFTANHSTANTTDITINAVISGSGGLTLAGGGQLLLTGTNTYTGTTTINAGTLVVGANAPSGAAGALGNATSAVLLGNTTGSSNAALLTGGAFTVGRAVTLQAGNTGTNTLGGNTANASSFTGNITVSNTGGVTLTAATGGTATFSGVISGANPVIAIGPGTVVLSNAANTYTGATTVSGGVLSISADPNLGADPASATAGNVVINGGTLRATASFTLNSNRGIALGPTSGSGNGTIDVTGSNTLTYGGIIANNSTGTGSLVTIDTGTLTLSGANTYSGGTTINGGALAATNTSGSATGSGAVAVNTGGTLEGTGSVSGTVTASGGTVKPGFSPGILTAGAANFSSGGTLRIQVSGYGAAGTNYSQLNLGGGTLTAGGTSTLILDLSGLTTAGTATGIVLYGSVVGTFTTVTVVNNPLNFDVTLSYTASSLNVTVAVHFVAHFKFNNPGNSPPPGYTSILPTTTYSAGQGYGWVTTTGLFAQDRGGPTPLLRDLIAGSDDTFQVDVPAPGTYVVNLTMGDLLNPHDFMDVIANGTDEFASNLLYSPAGQFITPSFTVSVASTHLQLEIKDLGGEPSWVVNAIDIRAIGQVGTITLMASPSTITADGVSTSTISGTSSLPQGSLVTVATSLGTITTADADPNYAGNQVVVGPGGAFSFTVRAPLGGGQATITAHEVTGAADGSTTLAFTPPSAFHFEFNAPGSPTASGYASVLPTTTYNAATSYGWTTTTGLFTQDRGGPTTLLRSFTAGPDNTFRVDLPNGTYTANVTLGDTINPHGPIDVLQGGVSLLGGNLINTTAGQFITRSFPVTVTGGNLQLEFKSLGDDGVFVLNALDLYTSTSAITLMSSAPTLPADGTSTVTISGTGAVPNSLITVATTLGTITTTDVDPNYAGVQVHADGSGHFSFVLQAPSSSGGTPLITATDVTGAAAGSSSTILMITPPGTFHLDFVYPPNPTPQAGYTSVLPTTLYSTSVGYGWQTSGVSAQDRGANNAPGGVPSLLNLQRALQFAHDDTFEVLVHVTGVTHFNVTLYLGDNNLPHNQTVVIGGSAGTVNEGNVQTGTDNPNPNLIAGGFVINTYSIPAADFTPDANGNDILTIHLTGITSLHDPGDNAFSVNGVDVVASTMDGPAGNGSGVLPPTTTPVAGVPVSPAAGGPIAPALLAGPDLTPALETALVQKLVAAWQASPAGSVPAALASPAALANYLASASANGSLGLTDPAGDATALAATVQELSQTTGPDGQSQLSELSALLVHRGMPQTLVDQLDQVFASWASPA
jgi:autotransporter-associated beta strand protein